MPAGRPTDFTPELGEQILVRMEQGLSLAAAAGELNIHRQRVYDWEKKYPEFADVIDLGRVKRQAFLERRLLDAKDSPRVTSSIFALKNASPWDWRETQHQEHTGKDGGPIESHLLVTDGDRARALAAFLARTKALKPPGA